MNTKNDWSNTGINSANYLLQYRFLDNFGNNSEYSNPIIVPIISPDSGDPISITSLAGYNGDSYVTGLANNSTSPRTVTTSLGMTSQTYAASNVTRPSPGSDSLLYTWQPVTSGSNYSYDVYLSWRTGLNPPVIATSATLKNYDSGAHTATLAISPENGDVSKFIVGQYITATNPAGGGPPTSFGSDCYVSAINTSESSIDIVFSLGDEYINYSYLTFTNIKSQIQTWLPFQFAGTTKANSFSFQIKDIQTGSATVSDVQFVQALVSISTYPKYENDYMSWQTIWSMSPAFSTWQTPQASLSTSTTTGTGDATQYYSTLTINGSYVNPFPTISVAKDIIGKQIVNNGGQYAGTIKAHTQYSSGTSSFKVQTSSNVASAVTLTNLTL